MTSWNKKNETLKVHIAYKMAFGLKKKLETKGLCH